MGNILGIAGSHNGGVALYIPERNTIEVIEVERLLNIKNAAYATYNPAIDPNECTQLIKAYVKKHFNVDKFDVVRSISSDFDNRHVAYDYDFDIFEHNTQRFDKDGNVLESSSDTGMCSGDGWAAYHHKSHAANTFYQSNFEDALVFSFDGGGDDGWFLGYHFDKTKPKNEQVKTIHFSFRDMGSPYFFLGYFIDDIDYIMDWGEACLTYAGKLMGYCSYGDVRDEWYQPVKEYYNRWIREGWRPVENEAYDILTKLSEQTGLKFDWLTYDDGAKVPSGKNRLQGKDAYDLIATSQKVFEDIFFDEVSQYIDLYKTNVCITGGCAMNILNNTKIREYVQKNYNKDVFVAPNSSDCGLAAGLVLDHLRPDQPIDLTYSGMDILDKDSYPKMLKIDKLYHEDVDLSKLVSEIKLFGFIFGLVQGKSEHGPRALGNRSIICSPKEGMKDTLNLKVKGREFYRPFAPVCRLEDVSKFFEWEGESKHMNYAAIVKDEYREDLASITHNDNTARIQTVTREQNRFLYDLLSEMDKNNITPVLLNTSFNVAGKPILNSYEDALTVLNNTEMDGLVIINEYTKENGKLFFKAR